MTFYLKELKWLILYSCLSLLLSITFVWLNKEIIWIGLLILIDWIDFSIIVTNVFEGIITYLKLSIFIGIIIFSFFSLILLWISFFIPGLYKNELKSIKRKLIWWILSNIILFPIVLRNINKLFLSEELLLIGKMNEILYNIINIFIILQILIFIPILLQYPFVQQSWIENRSIIILVLYIGLAIVTPPDLYISILLLSVLTILIESIILWNSLIHAQR